MYISSKDLQLQKKIAVIINLSGFGDWMMLYMLARNTDRVTFGQVCVTSTKLLLWNGTCKKRTTTD